MDFTPGGVDHELRQARLSSFGRVLATVALVLVFMVTAMSIWLGRVSFNRASVPLVVAAAAFAALGPVHRPPHSGDRRADDPAALGLHLHRVQRVGSGAA